VSVGFIDKKGRFTIPQALREALREALALEPGAAVAYTIVGNELRLTRIDDPYGPVARAVVAEFERGETTVLRSVIAELGIDMAKPDLPEDEGVDDD